MVVIVIPTKIPAYARELLLQSAPTTAKWHHNASGARGSHRRAVKYALTKNTANLRLRIGSFFRRDTSFVGPINTVTWRRRQPCLLHLNQRIATIIGRQDVLTAYFLLGPSLTAQTDRRWHQPRIVQDRGVCGQVRCAAPELGFHPRSRVQCPRPIQ